MRIKRIIMAAIMGASILGGSVVAVATAAPASASTFHHALADSANPTATYYHC
jgi:hypothetical protein